MKIFNFDFKTVNRNKLKEAVLIAVILLIAAVAHGYNMFHFPYYENDEGVYLSQTWSFMNEGKLAPYTYWYDHAPAGWMLMTIWIKLIGGFFAFGSAINSGRVLMLFFHLAAVILVLYITKKLSGNLFPGIMAVLIFSLSPLAIYFQRRILLDNIMIFWVLLSFALLLVDNFRLTTAFFSAAAFGLAVLTKENAIFFLPAFLYTIASRGSIQNKVFTFVQWLATSGLIISIYFLYAFLRGELFPIGFLGDTKEHVSLISSLIFQFTRGSRLPFWNPQSDFYVNLQEWMAKDSFTITLGAAATVVSLLLAIKVKELRIPALFALLFWVFLMRGDLVFNFYVIPAIPLLALNFGLLAEFLFKQFSLKVRYLLRMVTLIALVLGIFYLTPLNPYTRDETRAQTEAINWVKENLPSQTYMVIDNYAFIDLRESRFPGDKAFPNADWFWKLDYDPSIRDEKYGHDWRKIEYIILSHEMVRQMKLGTQKILQKAFDNSHPVIEWREGSIAYIDLGKQISTNGDWMAIFKINDKRDVALKQSWEYFKKNFITGYGQVIDPTNGEVTTSEGQAYTMLRAVWENDPQTFQGVWQWTKDHLQHRDQDKLLSWLWKKEGNEYKLGDFATASDADEDVALALLFAGKKWKNDNYINEAKGVIGDIWKQEVKEINGEYYLISGADTEVSKRGGYLLNPSYFSPATYKIFAEVDKSHPWNKLVDSSYRLLDKFGRLQGNQTYLPPNWLFLDYNGNLKPATGYVEKDPNVYGYDAFRTFWRIGLDAIWFKENRANAYLKKIEPFFSQKWKEKGKFSALYDLGGGEKVNYDSLSTNAGPLSLFSVTNPKLAETVYGSLFENRFNFDEGYWPNAKDYYDQSWGWFGTALFSRQLPNLWPTQTKFKLF